MIFGADIGYAAPVIGVVVGFGLLLVGGLLGSAAKSERFNQGYENGYRAGYEDGYADRTGYRPPRYGDPDELGYDGGKTYGEE